jgi:hypothetical protein
MVIVLRYPYVDLFGRLKMGRISFHWVALVLVVLVALMVPADAATPGRGPERSAAPERKYGRFQMEYTLKACLLKDGHRAGSGANILKSYPQETVLQADFLVPEGVEVSGSVVLPEGQWILLEFKDLALDARGASFKERAIIDNLAMAERTGVHKGTESAGKGETILNGVNSPVFVTMEERVIINKAGQAKSVAVLGNLRYMGLLEVAAATPEKVMLRSSAELEKQVEADFAALGPQ